MYLYSLWLMILVVLQYVVPGYRCVPLLQALNGYQLDEEGEGEGDKRANGEGPGEGQAREQVQMYVVDSTQPSLA